MRYLGIDYGSSYIGLAMGDDESFLALPFDTVEEKDLERQLKTVVQLVLDEGVDVVIVGYPLTLDGGQSEQTSRSLDFIEELAGRVSIEVLKEDERLTSSFAQSLKKDYEGGKHDEHALAAAAILQTHLDRKKHHNDL